MLPALRSEASDEFLNQDPGQEFEEFIDGEVSLGENVQHRTPDGAGGAQYRDVHGKAISCSANGTDHLLVRAPLRLPESAARPHPCTPVARFGHRTW